MARIVFFTLYNSVAAGVRILSSVLRREGHEVRNILLKMPSNSAHLSPLIEIDDPFLNPEYCQSMNTTGLFYSNYAVSPVTTREKSLLGEAVAEFAPDFICLSATSYLQNMSLELMSMLHSQCPDSVCVAGGYGPTFSPAAYLGACDYVVIGEGEKALPDLVRRRQGGGDPRATPNVAYLENGVMKRNALCSIVSNLNELPYPDYRTGNFVSIENDMVENKDPLGSYYISIGRGCPGKCTYCCTQQFMQKYRIEGHAFPVRRLRSIDNVMQELELAKGMGFNYIHFFDDYIVGPHQYIYDFFKCYKERIGLPFFGYLHYSQVRRHPEIIDTAIEAGLDHSVCGIQHGGDDFAHSKFGRNIPIDDIIFTANKFIQNGIHYNYDFITDTPIESENDFRSQLENIKKIPFSSNYTHIGIARLKVFPETEIEQLCRIFPRTQFADVSWVYKSTMIILRFIMEDDEFFEILDNDYYKKYPQTLLNNLPYYYSQYFIRTASSCLLQDMRLLRFIYEHYSLLHLNKDILIWGTGTRYRELKYIFSKNKIAGFLDNNPEMKGKIFEGQKVYGPEELGSLPPAPVFICSVWKPEIHAQLTRLAPERVAP